MAATQATKVESVNPEPLFFYRMVPGVSLRIGAVVVNGKTLYGPVSLPPLASFDAAVRRG